MTEPRLNLVERWLTRLLHVCFYSFPVMIVCYFVFGIFEDGTSPEPGWANYDDMGGDYVWMLYAALGCIIAAFWIGVAVAALRLWLLAGRYLSSASSNHTP